MNIRDEFKAFKSQSTKKEKYKEGSIRHQFHDPKGYKAWEEKQKATKKVAPAPAKVDKKALASHIMGGDKLDLFELTQYAKKNPIYDSSSDGPRPKPSRGNIPKPKEMETWTKKQEKLKPKKTPYDPVYRPGGVPVGMNIIQPYEEDSIVKKGLKGIVNYGGGTIGRMVGSVGQTLMNVADNTNNAIKGKPQNWGEKSFKDDILEPTFPGAKDHPVISGLVESILDPTTYVGGGIVDDLTKAGRFGKSAQLGTKENLSLMDNLGKKATKDTVKKTQQIIQAPTSQNKPSISTNEIPVTQKHSDSISAMPKKPMIDDVPEYVQRIEEPNISRATVDKPHGVYTSPADIESPHKGLGGDTFYWKTNPKANVLKVVTDVFETNRGLVGESAGVAAARKFLGDTTVSEMMKMPKRQLIDDFSYYYPDINWNRYYDNQEMVEALAGIKARENGFDAIWAIDESAPDTNEFVGLTSKAFEKTVDALPAPTSQNKPLNMDKGNLPTKPKELPLNATQDKKGYGYLQTFTGDEPLIKKESQFRSNTIERSTTIPDHVKELIKPGEFDYIPETSKEWQEQAVKNIETDRAKVMRDIYESKSINGGTQAHEAAILAHDLLKEAEEIGSYAKFKSFLKTVAEKTRETARALKGTDTAWDKKSVDGVIMDGQRIVDNIEDDIKKTNPNKINRIDKQTKDVTDALDKAKKEAAKQVEKELPEELLAKKVSGTLSTRTRNPNPVMDMVNELFKVAKESPLPTKELPIKRNPIEFLKHAIQNKGQYADVWEKAKGIVKTKFADNEEALQILDDYFDKGIIPTYSDNTLNRSLQTSMKSLGQKLEDIAKSNKGDRQQALKDLTDYLVTTTGATSDEAILLANKIQKRFDILVKEKSQQLLKGMFKEVPKKGQKTVYQKVMEIIHLGGYEDNAIRDLIKQKEGLPILSDDDIKKISEYMGKSKTFPDGSYDQTEWLKKAQQIISDKIPASNREKFRGLQRISLILNPKSLITRNPLGNTLLGAAENIKDAPGALIDMLVSLGTKERTTALNPFPKLKGQAKGLVKGAVEWGKDVKRGVDTSPSRGQVELPQGRTFNNKVLNAIDQFERKLLQLGDRPFYQAAYDGRIAELKGLGRTIDDNAMIEAKQYALDRVFQNNSVLSEKARMIKNGLGPIGDIVMPFTQTPANILDKLIDYSPGGFIKAITQLGSIKKGTFNQKLFVDRIGRSLTGLGIGILGYAMAKKGVITGKRNEDTDVANYEQSLGKSPYAVKIGDTYHTFDWAQPVSGILAMGADIYFAGKEQKDAISAISAGVKSAGNTLINQSLFQGIVNLFSGYNDPVGGLAKTALNAPLQFAPTFTSNIAKQIDPYVRETYDPNPLKQTANKFAAKIPFASKALPVKVNQFGEEVKQQQGTGPINKAVNLFLNPSLSTTFKPNETQKEILRLYEEGGTKVQFPTTVDKYIEETKDHPRINLTPSEFTQYQKLTGELTMKKFAEIINTSDYKNTQGNDRYTADEIKAKWLSDLISEAKAEAKREILRSRGYES